ncbi:hypothetical protein [Sphingomonas solaris]|uniref:Uncharacterized protein n=1 Tax=Alterirhizorhabdus solaris TaxID=2529389 RepID=A0A558QW56_9SPHN|nr:hypothetical protein [Sphingomonas solaris]TVV71383.1 hypothetical protein FOY91_16960 [Sphingomonas solaris]
MMIAALIGLAAVTDPVRHLPEPVIADLFDDPPALPAPLPPAPAVGAVTILLRWPAAVAVTVEQTEGDLIARYDRLLDEAHAAAFAAAVGDRLDRLDWGPDNLVMRGRPDQRLTARILPDGLAILFETLPPLPEAAEPDDGRDAGLLRAQAEAAAGYPARARCRIATIAAAWPDDPAVQASLASAEYASGRVEDAAARYRASPDGGGVAGRAAARAVGPATEASALLRDGRGFDQQEVTVRVGAPLSATLRLEAGARHVRSRGDDPAGATIRRKMDATEGGLSLAARVAPDVRLRLDITTLLDANIVGTGITASVGDPERRGTLRLAYHLPDLATSPGALLGGWIDRAGIGGGARFAPGFTVRAEGGGIRYGLIGGGRRVTSLVAEGGLEYLVRRRLPTLALAYRFDGEYILDRRVADIAYSAIANRENHIVEGTIGQPIGGRLALTGVAGWTVNRYGGSGPVASLGLSLVPVNGWEASLIGGISSISRAGLPERQRYGRLNVTRRLGATP